MTGHETSTSGDSSLGEPTASGGERPLLDLLTDETTSPEPGELELEDVTLVWDDTGVHRESGARPVEADEEDKSAGASPLIESVQLSRSSARAEPTFWQRYVGANPTEIHRIHVELAGRDLPDGRLRLMAEAPAGRLEGLPHLEMPGEEVELASLIAVVRAALVSGATLRRGPARELGRPQRDVGPAREVRWKGWAGLINGGCIAGFTLLYWLIGVAADEWGAPPLGISIPVGFGLLLTLLCRRFEIDFEQRRVVPWRWWFVPPWRGTSFTELDRIDVAPLDAEPGGAFELDLVTLEGDRIRIETGSREGLMARAEGLGARMHLPVEESDAPAGESEATAETGARDEHPRRASPWLGRVAWVSMLAAVIQIALAGWASNKTFLAVWLAIAALVIGVIGWRIVKTGREHGVGGLLESKWGYAVMLAVPFGLAGTMGGAHFVEGATVETSNDVLNSMFFVQLVWHGLLGALVASTRPGSAAVGWLGRFAWMWAGLWIGVLIGIGVMIAFTVPLQLSLDLVGGMGDFAAIGIASLVGLVYGGLLARVLAGQYE